jgi:hypothetical protein
MFHEFEVPEKVMKRVKGLLGAVILRRVLLGVRKDRDYDCWFAFPACRPCWKSSG